MGHNEFMIIISSIILLTGSVLAAYANILLKIDSRSRTTRSESDCFGARKFLILAVILSAIAGASDLFVNAVIPLSVRACFTALNIPVNVFMARWVLDEHLSATQVVGIGVTVIGSLIAILSASHDANSQSSSNWRSMLNHHTSGPFLIFLGVSFVASVPQLRSSPQKSIPKVASLLACAFATSTVATACNVGAKFLGSALSRLSIWSGEIWGLSGILIGISVLQISFMSAFLAQFDVSVAVPIYQVMCGVLLSLTATLVFGEPVPHLETYLLGILASFFGLWLVATNHRRPKLKTDYMGEDQPLVVIQLKSVEDTELL